MRSIPFYKYQGTGNDFVLIDNRENIVDPTDMGLAKKLCDRKFGIGSDGLILIQNHQEYDFAMIFFNPDGSQSMCGNGSRCAVKFAHDTGIISGETRFLSTDGEHTASIKEDIVSLSMRDVHPASIQEFDDHMTINTGSPHYVIFTSNLPNKDVAHEGAAIRYSEDFEKEGINVNFVEKHAEDTISVRTYERGVEAETLSCGTGVTACAIAHLLHGGSSPVKINTLGGELNVSCELANEGANQLILTGPAMKVFEGTIIL